MIIEEVFHYGVHIVVFCLGYHFAWKRGFDHATKIQKKILNDYYEPIIAAMHQTIKMRSKW